MFIINFFRKLFGIRRYSLKYSDKVIKSLHVKIDRVSDMIEPEALEREHKVPYRFNREIIKDLLKKDLNFKTLELANSIN